MCRAPDSARVKAKMMYASTKDYFKTHLDGLSLVEDPLRLRADDWRSVGGVGGDVVREGGAGGGGTWLKARNPALCGWPRAGSLAPREAPNILRLRF